MPRTIWRQTDPRLASDPHFSSESYLRACAEEHHYEILRKAYAIPLYISPPPPQAAAAATTTVSATTSGQAIVPNDGAPPRLPADAQLTRPIAIRDPFTNQNRGRTLATLTGSSTQQQRAAVSDPGRGDEERGSDVAVGGGGATTDDLRLFCWKDVVVYANTGIQASEQIGLLDQIYREWFPHRAEDKDVSDGAFWGLLIRFTPPGSLLRRPNQGSSSSEDQQEAGFIGIGGLWEWHAALGRKLKDLQEEEEEHGISRASHGLRQSLQDVLVIIDGNWQEEGVWLVWKDAETAKSYNCTGSSNGVKECDAGDWRPGCVFRCSLKRAMQITVSRDPFRAQERTEWSELLEETLGDGNESGS